MNAREKTLAIVVGGCVAVIVCGLGLKMIIVKPLQELDKRTQATRNAIAKVQEERRQFFAAEDKVKAHTMRAFADTVDRASAASGELITKEIGKSGLQESGFTRLPVGPRKMRGASEIGWNIQGQGPLTNIVDFIYTLGNEPHLSQVDSLVISPGDSPGLVKVRFRFLTLVVDPAPDVVRTQLVSTVNLQSPARLALDSISQRDLLRPYLKRPPEPPPKTNRRKGDEAPTSAPPGPETFRVVSLSDWDGAPEIHIRDTVSNKTQRYVAGDELIGGKIVMIDYRHLPFPGRAPLLSTSRVIVKVGEEYWAIDRGNTLADKRLLEKSELPAELAMRKE